jgi:hypothetical protein
MTKVLFSILYTKISETVNDYYDKLATTITVEVHTPRKSTKIMKKKNCNGKDPYLLALWKEKTSFHSAFLF